MPQSDIAASEKTPNTTLFIEFPATYQEAGTGYQLATSKGTWEPLAVEGAADNRKLTVFSSAYKLLAALRVKLRFQV